MIIALIGMSGSGKTYWSKKLESYDFTRYCCDDLIEKRLKEKFKKLKCSGIQDVARWMGQPYDSQYQRTSKIYVDCEKEVLLEILRATKKNLIHDKNVVIDTTGSVIYAGKRILVELSQLAHVVYLPVPDTVKNDMYKVYIDDPKPVVWENSFSKKQKEENISALERCYPKLLTSRTKKYEKLAATTLDYFQLRDGNFDIKEFIELLKKKR